MLRSKSIDSRTFVWYSVLMLATQDVYWPSPNDLRRERLIQRRRVIDLQEIAFAREAADFAASDAWDEDGSVSAIDWLRFNCHMNAGAAANSIAVGEMLERLPESHRAVVDCEIGFAHLATMARTAEALGDRFDEKVLVEKAKENSPGKFFYICHHARHAADPKTYAAEQAEQVEQRRLKLSTWMDGSLLISGQLDPVGGAAFLTRLAPLARRSGAYDHRDQEQRNADALVELASAGRAQPRSRSRARSRLCLRWPVRRQQRWSTRSLFRPRPSSAWLAIPASPASSSTPSRR